MIDYKNIEKVIITEKIATNSAVGKCVFTASSTVKVAKSIFITAQ